MRRGQEVGFEERRRETAPFDARIEPAIDGDRAVGEREVVVDGSGHSVGAGHVAKHVRDRLAAGARDDARALAAGRRQVVTIDDVEKRPVDLAPRIAADEVVREVETDFLPRRRGQSFMSNMPWRVVWGCLVDVGRGLLEFRLGRP